jgi:hypothetical protein
MGMDKLWTTKFLSMPIHGLKSVDNYGQNVAWTNSCMDKQLQGQNVAKKNVAWANGCEDKMLYGQNGAWIFRWKLRAPHD